jgi:exonuclease III
MNVSARSSRNHTVEVVDERFIVAGDWNTARKQGTEKASRIGAEFFERAEHRGWHDCVWEKGGGEVKTWFGSGRILQDDHAFCDPALGKQLRDVWVAADAARSLSLSDHAPLVLDFEVSPIAMTGLASKPRRAAVEVEPD